MLSAGVYLPCALHLLYFEIESFFFFKLKNPVVENSEGNSKDRKRLHLS